MPKEKENLNKCLISNHISDLSEDILYQIISDIIAGSLKIYIQLDESTDISS